jgi:hypothetical protein
MVQGARGKGWGWLWTACALSAACEGDKPAPGVEYDPNLVDEAGVEAPPRPPLVGGGGRADAGKDAAPEDAAAGASDAGLEGGALDDAQLDDAGAQPEPGALESAERLLVADGLEQRVYAYDVTSRGLLESFAIGARARVYAGPGGRYGYALPTGGGDVRIVDMGLVQEQTGPGIVRRLAPAAQLDVRLSGTGSATLLAQSDWVALFFDGDAKLEVVRESSLSEEQGVPETQSVALGAAHLGFGLPFDGGFLATHLETGSQLVLSRYDEGGTRDSDVSYDCDAPLAAALAGGALAVSCEAGVLRLDPGGAARVIAYPDAGGAPAARAGRLVGHPSEALYLTQLGDGLCVVGASALTCQSLSSETLDFGFDASGKRALVLGSDGILHVFAAQNLQPLGMLRVTSAVITSDVLVQPRLASGRRLTYVSDPQAASVHMVDPASLKLAGRLELPGTPASLAVFGFR